MSMLTKGALIPCRVPGVATSTTDSAEANCFLACIPICHQTASKFGVALGMELKNLERLNGVPFTMAGFGWDYGGTIKSNEQVLRDRPFQSDDSLMQELNPKIHAVMLRY